MSARANDAIVPCRFEGGKYGLAVRRNGRLISTERWCHLLDRATGQRFQTRRSLLVGATPHDRANHHLINGWHP